MKKKTTKTPLMLAVAFGLKHHIWLCAALFFRLWQQSMFLLTKHVMSRKRLRCEGNFCP